MPLGTALSGGLTTRRPLSLQTGSTLAGGSQQDNGNEDEAAEAEDQPAGDIPDRIGGLVGQISAAFKA